MMNKSKKNCVWYNPLCDNPISSVCEITDCVIENLACVIQTDTLYRIAFYGYIIVFSNYHCKILSIYNPMHIKLKMWISFWITNFFLHRRRLKFIPCPCRTLPYLSVFYITHRKLKFLEKRLPYRTAPRSVLNFKSANSTVKNYFLFPYKNLEF